MEVVHRRVEEEEVVEQLQTRRQRRPDSADPGGDDTSSRSDESRANVMSNGHMSKEKVDKINGVSEKSVYFDKNEGKWKCHHCIWTYKIGHPWIHQKSLNHGIRETSFVLDKNHITENVDIPGLVSAIMNNQNVTDEILSGLSTSNPGSKEGNPSKMDESVRIDHLMEESDEEIELEFERAVEKVHTHTPYCPKCNNQITKVILRRKKKDKPRPDKPLDIFGCLKCFSIFVPSDNCFKNIFKWGDGQKVTENDEDDQASRNPEESGNGKQKLTETGHRPVIAPPHSSQHMVIDIEDETGGTKGGQKPRKEDGIEVDKSDESKHHPEHHEDGKTTAGPRGTIGATAVKPVGAPGARHSKSLEILKCIVYGGLIECIASLSVVSSAAASEASTLNVIAIGFATVFSGLLVVGHNLIDIKNDDVSGQSSNQHKDRYQELLGTRGHFVLHASFAVLSYLLFGLIPPTTYAFMFRDTDNKDYKILSAAVASFACVFLLAIGKAYVRRPEKYSAYVKTTLYYLTMAVSVSGVAYAAGDLVGMLMEKAGWFEPAQAANLLAPGMTSAASAWASY